MSYPVLMMIAGAVLFLLAPLFSRGGNPQHTMRIRMNGLMLAVIGFMFSYGG